MAEPAQVDLSSLDKVRRFFGVPTLMEQMLAEKKAAQAEANIKTNSQAIAAGVAPRDTGTVMQQQQGAYDTAMDELRRQEAIRKHNAGGR